MHFFAKNLKKEGWRVVNWEYQSRDRSIEAHAETLVAKLMELATSNPGKPINFVTHSMGGLIVRAAVNHPSCPLEAKVGKAVMLSPPNQGSNWGRLIGKYSIIKKLVKEASGRELTAETDFEHLGELPSTMKVLVIAGDLSLNPFIKEKNDGIVTVGETKLTSPHKHIVLKRGHSSIVFSKKAFIEGKKFLEQQ